MKIKVIAFHPNSCWFGHKLPSYFYKGGTKFSALYGDEWFSGNFGDTEETSNDYYCNGFKYEEVN